MCFDISNSKSFDNMEMWMREVGKHGGESLPVAVVGLKLDLANSKRAIKKEDATSWAKSRDFIGYYEVSAKEQKGYFDLMSDVVNHLLN